MLKLALGGGLTIIRLRAPASPVEAGLPAPAARERSTTDALAAACPHRVGAERSVRLTAEALRGLPGSTTNTHRLLPRSLRPLLPRHAA